MARVTAWLVRAVLLAVISWPAVACGLEEPSRANEIANQLARLPKPGKLNQGPALVKIVDDAGVARPAAATSRELTALVDGLRAVLATRPGAYALVRFTFQRYPRWKSVWRSEAPEHKPSPRLLTKNSRSHRLPDCVGPTTHRSPVDKEAKNRGLERLRRAVRLVLSQLLSKPTPGLERASARAPAEPLQVADTNPSAGKLDDVPSLLVAQHPVDGRARGARHVGQVLLCQRHDSLALACCIALAQLAETASHARLCVRVVRFNDTVAGPGELLRQEAQEDVLDAGMLDLQAGEVVAEDGAGLSHFECFHRGRATGIRQQQRELAERVSRPEHVEERALAEGGRDADGEAASYHEVERLCEIVAMEDDLTLAERSPAGDGEQPADVLRRHVGEERPLHEGKCVTTVTLRTSPARTTREPSLPTLRSCIRRRERSKS